MNAWDSHWLALLPAFWAGQWTPTLTLIAGLLAMLLLAMFRRRPPHRQGPPPAPRGGREDQFASSAPISEEQVGILRYLQAAFPDGAVLFKPRLCHFLVPRTCRHVAESRQRLAASHIDFLICAEDGEPVFAFAIDAFRDLDDEEVARQAEEMNSMLRTAGIRLIRLKGAQTLWPPPEVLRMRLMAVRRQPVPAEPARPKSMPAEPAPARAPVLEGFATTGPSTRSHWPESDVMGLATLMAMPPAAEGEADPWAAVRKR